MKTTQTHKPQDLRPVSVQRILATIELIDARIAASQERHLISSRLEASPETALKMMFEEGLQHGLQSTKCHLEELLGLI
jgi:hypothetical protein